jgi:hypothetical protein
LALNSQTSGGRSVGIVGIELSLVIHRCDVYLSPLKDEFMPFLVRYVFQINSSSFEQVDARHHASYAVNLSLLEVFEGAVLLNRYLALFGGLSWLPTSPVFKIYSNFLRWYLTETVFQKGSFRDGTHFYRNSNKSPEQFFFVSITREHW